MALFRSTPDGDIPMTPEEEAEFVASLASLEVQVLTVTAAQAVIALERAGLLTQVDAVVAAYPKEVQLWYARALTWERYNPYVIGIGLELGLTDEQVDALFVSASKL
jgi:hypothetical protein